MDAMLAQPTEDGGFPVVLRIYDLSRGMAATFSQALLGKRFEGIWHTGVYVFGNEYYFGGGIQMDPIDFVEARVGRPVQTLLLGYTYIPQEMFHEYLRGISHLYTAQTYNLLTHNCNNFSSEISKFLTGTEIPEYILNLPQEALSTPLGSIIRNLMDGFQSNMQHSGAIPGFAENSGIFQPSQPSRDATVSAAPTVEQPSTRLTSEPPPLDSSKQAWSETKQQESVHTPSHNFESKQGGDNTEQTQKSMYIEPSNEFNLSMLLSDQGTATASLPKIVSLSASMTGASKLTDGEIETLSGLVNGNSNAVEIAKVLDKMIRGWPLPNLMPVLLCAKIVALNEASHSIFCEREDSIERVVKIVSTFDETVSKYVRIMALCFITNMFAKKTGCDYLTKEELLEPILDAVIRGLYHSDVNIRATSSALLQNIIISVTASKSAHNETLTQITCALSDRIASETDEPTATRIVEHLGFIKARDAQQAQLIVQLQLVIPEHLRSHKSARIARLATVLAAE